MLESVLPGGAFSFPGVQGKGPGALSSFTKSFLYCLEQWLELASHSDAQGGSKKLLCEVEAKKMRDKLVLLSQPHTEDQRYPLTMPCLIDELMLHARFALRQSSPSEGMDRNKSHLSQLFNMAGSVMASTRLVQGEDLPGEQVNQKMQVRAAFLDCFMKHIFSVVKKNGGQISLKHSLLEYIFDPDAVSQREVASQRTVNTGPVCPKKRAGKSEPEATASSRHKKEKKNTPWDVKQEASLFRGSLFTNFLSQGGMPVSGPDGIVPNLKILPDGADGASAPAPVPAYDLSRLSFGLSPTDGTDKIVSSADCAAFDPCIYDLFSLEALEGDPVLKLG